MNSPPHDQILSEPSAIRIASGLRSSFLQRSMAIEQPYEFELISNLQTTKVKIIWERAAARPFPRPSSASITVHPAEGPVFPRRNRVWGRGFVKIQAVIMAAGLTLVSTYAFAEPLQPGLGGVLPPPKINRGVRSVGRLP